MIKLGPLIVGIAGTALSEAEREMLLHPLVGGVILFSRNFDNTEQLAALTQSIKSLRTPQLLIGVDHEGGRVQRFHAGFTTILPMGEIGRLYDASPVQALQLAKTCGALIAVELLQYQIDLNFGPVLDLNSGVSKVIGDRAFHHDPKVVVELATALVDGLDQAGMAAIGKHFPGHGSVAPDTHLESVVDTRDFAALQARDLIPFQAHNKIGLRGVMTAHVTYPQIDSEPATFSKIWLQQILRQQLKFNGVIISDDLGMAAAKRFGSATDATRAALDAGCDMVLLCNETKMIEAVLDQLPASYHDDCQRQVQALSCRRVVNKTWLSNTCQTLMQRYRQQCPY